jgi:hypothetical protein
MSVTGSVFHKTSAQFFVATAVMEATPGLAFS